MATASEKYNEQTKFYLDTIESLFYSQTNGSALIFNAEDEEAYRIKHCKDPNSKNYWDTQVRRGGYTNNYDYILHLDTDNSGYIKLSIFVENACCGADDSDYIHYSPEIAFDMLSDFFYELYKTIEAKYPNFNRNKDYAEWGDGERTATATINYTTFSGTLKTLFSQIDKNNSELENFDKNIIERIKNQKSSLKTCPACNSKLNINYITSIKCPTCKSSSFGYTDTDLKKLTRLKEVKKSLSLKLSGK